MIVEEVVIRSTSTARGCSSLSRCTVNGCKTAVLILCQTEEVADDKEDDVTHERRCRVDMTVEIWAWVAMHVHRQPRACEKERMNRQRRGLKRWNATFRKVVLYGHRAEIRGADTARMKKNAHPPINPRLV